MRRVGLPITCRRQAGFTIIEMVVALFIFALAMAVAMPALGNMLDLGNRGSANAQASSGASYALQLLEADLRRAGAARGSSDVEEGTSVISALSRAETRYHDIVEAGPTRLSLWSDALGTRAGPELVTYELVHQTSRVNGRCDRQARRAWCVTRTVQAAGTTLREVIVRGAGVFPHDETCIPAQPGATPVAAQRLFCYQHKRPTVAGSLNQRYQWAAWRPTCEATWGPPPSGVADWNQSPVALGAPIPAPHDRINSTNASVRALDTISAIGIVLPSGGRTEGARALTVSVTTVDLRNRSSEEYQSAILCGGR